jgi:hypothetical protein
MFLLNKYLMQQCRQNIYKGKSYAVSDCGVLLEGVLSGVPMEGDSPFPAMLKYKYYPSGSLHSANDTSYSPLLCCVR